jgi:hypothetical protein
MMTMEEEGAFLTSVTDRLLDPEISFDRVLAIAVGITFNLIDKRLVDEGGQKERAIDVADAIMRRTLEARRLMRAEGYGGRVN